jgi:hypothetical protein
MFAVAGAGYYFAVTSDDLGDKPVIKDAENL